VAVRARLASRPGGSFLVGAGTVLSRHQLEAARRAHADFAVSPLLDPALVSTAVEEGLPFIPGALTPTEVATAWAAGATFVKLFPASAVGPAFVRELRGPIPDAQLIPTGGIDASNAPAFLDAGAVAVGIGGAITRADAATRRAIVPRSPAGGAAGSRARFAGRNVLVTGSTGMAASAAHAIATEGGAVFVTSRDPAHAAALADEIGRAGGRCIAHAADLRREAEVEAAFAAFDRSLGRLDALYGVAGISGRRFGDGPLHEATLEGWETVMAANATSQFLVARAAVRRMLDQDPDAAGSRGSILLMSSTLATRPALHFATHAYAASKGAIEALTRSLAPSTLPMGSA
jgi:Entner-Doudoroff aldolase